jgi:hypothetical protein
MAKHLINLVSAIGLVVIITSVNAISASQLYDATPTPTPLPTPTSTPIPLSFTISQMGTTSDTIGAPLNPADWKTVLDTFMGIGTYADQAKADIDVRATQTPLEIDQTDPISMARGFAVVMSDFEWIGILMGFFTFAFLLIVAVEGIRLIVSLWGVIEKIIDLIKLIPFV